MRLWKPWAGFDRDDSDAWHVGIYLMGKKRKHHSRKNIWNIHSVNAWKFYELRQEQREGRRGGTAPDRGIGGTCSKGGGDPRRSDFGDRGAYPTGARSERPSGGRGDAAGLGAGRDPRSAPAGGVCLVACRVSPGREGRTGDGVRLRGWIVIQGGIEGRNVRLKRG